MTKSDNFPSSMKHATWIPDAASASDHPHMSDDFAKAYDETATRIMRPIATTAIKMAANIGPNTRVLDIAAGTGALSVPAAELGASVVAVDIAPGMVRRLSKKLSQFPNCQVQLMDGQALELPDASFDAAFSIVGVSLFTDWRAGLNELARVLRPGGRGCVATWRNLPGGGPFHVMAQALRAVFPDRPAPVPPEGFVALADPERLRKELSEAGFDKVSVEEIEAIWEGPAGEAYLHELKELHPYMGPYRLLEPRERRDVDNAILSIVNKSALQDRVRLRSSALIAVGTRE